MSDHISSSESRAARRERLRLLCAADRTRLRLVWRMPSQRETQREGWAGALMSSPALGALLPMMPGPIGRWSRRIGFGSKVLRAALSATF
jgi:hypothetical protein